MNKPQKHILVQCVLLQLTILVLPLKSKETAKHKPIREPNLKGDA